MRPTLWRLGASGFVAPVAGLLLAACVSQGVGAPAPAGSQAAIRTGQEAATATPETAAHDVALDPGVAPADLPKEACGRYTTTTDRVPPNLAALATNSAALVEGTIVDVGKAQWNTPDGRPPVRPDIEASRVIRLVRLSVKSTLSGSLASAVIAVPGGTVGCGTFETDVIPGDLAPGFEGLFFVGHDTPRTGMKETLVASEIWPVVDGRITMPGGDQLTIAQAQAALSK